MALLSRGGRVRRGTGRSATTRRVECAISHITQRGATTRNPIAAQIRRWRGPSDCKVG